MGQISRLAAKVTYKTPLLAAVIATAAIWFVPMVPFKGTLLLCGGLAIGWYARKLI